TIDFKGSGDSEFLRKFSSVPDPSPIYRALKEWKNQDVHIEITNLLVPEIGDSMERVKKMVKWIKNNIGEYTPIHFLRFFPTHLVLDVPETPVATLEKAYNLARELGMKYVYTGNIESEKINTYCPKCKRLLIKRFLMKTVGYQIKDEKCPFCGEKINIKGTQWIPQKLKSNQL
ncbi:MAG: AmmeMemoRadiSam system radical SAM enzyme, partial [Candidatus Bathyarchaeota archaeon]|nr:AmmeMemoRadiSam system radical SAM enzyme [Candidatus Bathyarchaeota archaeon]